MCSPKQIPRFLCTFYPTVHTFGMVLLTHTLLVQTHIHDVSAPSMRNVNCIKLIKVSYYIHNSPLYKLYLPDIWIRQFAQYKGYLIWNIINHKKVKTHNFLNLLYSLYSIKNTLQLQIIWPCKQLLNIINKINACFPDF